VLLNGTVADLWRTVAKAGLTQILKAEIRSSADRSMGSSGDHNKVVEMRAYGEKAFQIYCTVLRQP
jgi:hypothetical protein